MFIYFSHRHPIRSPEPTRSKCWARSLRVKLWEKNQSDMQIVFPNIILLKPGLTWIICKISGFLFDHQRRGKALAGSTTNHGVVFIHGIMIFLLKALGWKGNVWFRHLSLVHGSSFPWHCWQRRKGMTRLRKLATKSGNREDMFQLKWSSISAFNTPVQYWTVWFKNMVHPYRNYSSFFRDQ